MQFNSFIISSLTLFCFNETTGFVCTFYSTIGGMKAVLITDVFQSILMFAAIYSVIICAAIHVGGLKSIWDISQTGNRLEFLK